ncbi:MAG: ABC transporter ATP-binding protein [Candidatus Bathyarchaeia archaeon]|nr:ABC transporter ATP-binding protein [Candidatus Bathyarchaeota archaeon]
MQQYAVETFDLTKRFGNYTAVNGINLRVEAGTIHSLLGPNGAGKTTVLNMLSGVLKPTSGSAKILGFDVEKEPEKSKSLVGYLPEEPQIYETLTVREFLRLVGRAYSLPNDVLENRIDEYLELFDLKRVEQNFCGALSHGMKQRVVVCSILVHDPKVILLDEPFYGLDPASSRLFKEILRDKATNGCSILVSTHILEIAERLCDRVTILSEGRIVAEGTMDELKAKAGMIENTTLEDAFLALTRRNERSLEKQL